MKASKTTGRAHSISKTVKSEKDVKALVKSEVSEHFENQSIWQEEEKELWQLSLFELLELSRQNNDGLNTFWELYNSSDKFNSCLGNYWRSEVELIAFFHYQNYPSDLICDLINDFDYYFLSDIKEVMKKVPDLSYVDAVLFIEDCSQKQISIDIANFVFWFYRVPEKHQNKLYSLIRYTYNYTDDHLFDFMDDLVSWYNHKLIDDRVIEALLLFQDLEEIYQFVDYVQDIDFSNGVLLNFWLLKELKSQSKRRSLKFSKIENKPVWCDEEVWDLFNEEKAWKGAEIVHKIKDALIKAYAPSDYFYVCMARDTVPLYVLLFESGYDCMLGVFSRAQIGDEASLDLLKNEIQQAQNMTGKLALLIDIQERGTIYDHLQEEGIDHTMVFGVSSNPDCCRYPLLIDDDHIGKKAIKYLEKLPQSNGRAETVYETERCEGSYTDYLIGWGTRDPNAMGGDLEDWEILQFRGLFMECLGVNHCHAGMVGNDTQQRLWGIIKNTLPASDWQIGIAVTDTVLNLVRQSRYKTQHEVGNSNGTLDPEMRLTDEISQFGRTGIRPCFGTIWSTKVNSYLCRVGLHYGENLMILDAEKLLPYITTTREDSLGEDSDIFYPLTQVSELHCNRSSYNEIQVHTLITFESVLEVRSVGDVD